MGVACPLSGSVDVSLIEKIRTRDLIKAYDNLFKFDISAEFGDLAEIGFYHCRESDLRFFYPMRGGSESFYERLQETSWYYLENKPEFDYALRYITDSTSILEVGAGKGAFAKKIFNRKIYAGLEYSKKAIGCASEDDIEIIGQSVEQHAVQNPGKYDVVCAFQVLEHVENIRSFVDASLSCLKQGGLLVYSVPSADSFVGVARNNVTNLPPHHLSWWSDKSLGTLAELFKLEMIDIHHEKLSEIHKRWYASTVIFESLRKIFGYEAPLVDLSVKCRIMTLLSSAGSILLEKGLSDDRILPTGHSVTVVYRKTGATS